MINWISVASENEIEAIKERSNEIPCVIFKHSTRCPISSIAKLRLEDNWDFNNNEMEAYFLDLIRYRSVSNYIADTFDVHHESPQILLIKNGDCTYESSHLDITVDELKEVYSTS